MLSNTENIITIVKPFIDNTKKYPDFYIEYALVFENFLRMAKFTDSPFILDLSESYLITTGSFRFKYYNEKLNLIVEFIVDFNKENEISNFSIVTKNFNNIELSPLQKFLSDLKNDVKSKNQLVNICKSDETDHLVFRKLYFVMGNIHNYFEESLKKATDQKHESQAIRPSFLYYDLVNDKFCYYAAFSDSEKDTNYYMKYELNLDEQLNLIDDKFVLIDKDQYEGFLENTIDDQIKSMDLFLNQLNEIKESNRFTIHKIYGIYDEMIEVKKVIQLHEQQDQTEFHTYLKRNLGAILAFLKSRLDITLDLDIIAFKSYFQKYFGYPTVVFALNNNENDDIYNVRCILNKAAKITGIMQVWKENKTFDRENYHLEYAYRDFDHIETKLLKIAPGEKVVVF